MVSRVKPHLILFIMLGLLLNQTYVNSQEPQRFLLSVAISQNNQLALGYDNGDLEIIDRDTNTTTTTQNVVDRVVSLDWNPVNSDQLAVSTVDFETLTSRTIILSLLTGNVEAEFDYGTSIIDTKWSPDGQAIATSSNSGPNWPIESSGISVWNSQNGVLITFIASETERSYIRDFDWDTTGTRLAGSVENELVIWDTQSGNVLLRGTAHSDLVLSVDWSSENDKIATGSQDGSIVLWDSSNLAVQGIITKPDLFPFRFDWIGSTSEIAVENVANNSIEIWDTDELAFVGSIEASGSISGFVVDQNTQEIVIATRSTSNAPLQIEDLPTGSNVSEIIRLTSLCSPDPNTVRVWRVRNTNPDPVNFTWDVVGTDQTGSGTVPGGSADNPGEVTFETVTVSGANTTRLFVNGEEQDVKASTPDACNPDPTPTILTDGIYRAVQNPGDARVYIERNMAAGLDSFDSGDPDGWTLVGRTNGAGDNGTLQAFTVIDSVPYAAVQHATRGCIVVTPNDLGERRQGQTRLVSIVEEGVDARCTSDFSTFVAPTPEPPIEPEPTPTVLTEGIYRAVQNPGDARVYIERDMAAGLDSFDSRPTDGWTLMGRTNGSGNNGELRGFTVWNDIIPYAAIEHASKGCIVVTPNSLEERRRGQTRLVTIIEEGVAARCEGDFSDFQP